MCGAGCPQDLLLPVPGLLVGPQQGEIAWVGLHFAEGS